MNNSNIILNNKCLSVMGFAISAHKVFMCSLAASILFNNKYGERERIAAIRKVQYQLLIYCTDIVYNKCSTHIQQLYQYKFLTICRIKIIITHLLKNSFFTNDLIDSFFSSKPFSNIICLCLDDNLKNGYSKKRLYASFLTLSLTSNNVLLNISSTTLLYIAIPLTIAVLTSILESQVIWNMNFLTIGHLESSDFCNRCKAYAACARTSGFLSCKRSNNNNVATSHSSTDNTVPAVIYQIQTTTAIPGRIFRQYRYTISSKHDHVVDSNTMNGIHLFHLFRKIHIDKSLNRSTSSIDNKQLNINKNKL
ncbi:hypothetical protein AGLY_005492 [Aphis glycines]|uniref:Uncharacterized protein n=1 Tax=Aphis glycines TaxID=307491 RepID=A0A6G0TUN5_APHGL|nr:hypothetical protein AGLY_005492 [Aphis glycines]